MIIDFKMSVKKYFNLAKKVFFINRSITGKGTYKTLKIFSNEFRNFKIKKFHCGKKVTGRSMNGI